MLSDCLSDNIFIEAKAELSKNKKFVQMQNCQVRVINIIANVLKHYDMADF